MGRFSRLFISALLALALPLLFAQTPARQSSSSAVKQESSFKMPLTSTVQDASFKMASANAVQEGSFKIALASTAQEGPFKTALANTVQEASFKMALTSTVEERPFRAALSAINLGALAPEGNDPQSAQQPSPIPDYSSQASSATPDRSLQSLQQPSPVVTLGSTLRVPPPQENATAAELESQGDELRAQKAYLDSIDYYRAALKKGDTAVLHNKI